MASLLLASLCALFALGQCNLIEVPQEYNTLTNQIYGQDVYGQDVNKKEFKEVHYRLNKINKVLEQIQSDVEGVQSVVGYPNTVEEVLEVTDVDTTNNKNYKVIYDSDDLVKLVDSEGEDLDAQTLPKGSSVLAVVTQKSQKNWDLIKKSDVTIFFQHGSAVMVHSYNQQGVLKRTILGNPLINEEAQFTVVIPEGEFFAVQLLDKDQEAFTVLSYSFYPGYVSDNHVKFAVKEQQGDLYKPSYEVKKYFGLENSEDKIVNVYQEETLKSLFGDDVFEVPVQYKSVLPKSLQQLLKQQTAMESPMEYYFKKQIRQNKNWDLIKKIYGIKTQGIDEIKKYYEELPSFVKEYLHATPVSVRQYFDETPEDVKIYLDSLPVHVQKYFETTPQDVKHFFEQLLDQVKSHYEVMPQYIRKYFDVLTQKYIQQLMEQYHESRTPEEFVYNIPSQILKYFQQTPQDIKFIPSYIRKYMAVRQGLKEQMPQELRQYLEQIPVEIKSYFQNIPEQSQYVFGQYPVNVRRYMDNTPLNIKQYFEQNPRDVSQFFGGKQQTFDQVLPQLIKKYFQVKEMTQDVPIFFHKYGQVKEMTQDVPTFIKKYNQIKDMTENVPTFFNKYSQVKEMTQDVPTFIKKYSQIKDMTQDVPTFYKKYSQIKY